MSKKKKHYLTSTEICDIIEEDYLETYEETFSQNSSLIGKLPSLVENNLGYHMSTIEWSGYSGVAIYRIACKFIQKFNPEIKDYRRSIRKYEFGDKSNISSRNRQEFVKLTKYVLEDGKYFAQLDKNNYIIIILKTDNNNYGNIHTDIYIIGKKYRKWKDKFNSIIDKYKELETNQRTEVIQFSNGSRNITTMFKPFDKLIFKDKDNVLKYIDNWYKSIPTYYNKYKMIPKLSILLYGPPGTGKSTFYKALASYFKIGNVMVMSPDYFSRGAMTDERYSGYNYRSYPIINAIDDIDCICTSRDKTNNRDNSSTLSNLLAFLDNPPTFDLEAPDGIMYPVSIVVATTNYFDKLDKAVRRYGRFDLSLEMGNFNKKEAQQMCDIYDLKLSDVVKGANKKDFEISPSKLQALCLKNIDNTLKNKKDLNDPEVIDGKILIHRK